MLGVFALIFLTYLPESQIWKNFLFIQTNSFEIFTCQNLVLLVPVFGQVGQREDWLVLKLSELLIYTKSKNR